MKKSGVSYYLGCSETGELFATEAALEEQGWIHLLGYEEKNLITVTKEELSFKRNLIDLIITEMALTEQ